METPEDSSAGGSEQDLTSGVKLLVLNMPEDEGEGLGFRLTRTLWDPYPWVREVSPGSRAAAAGLRPGHCLLQADGKDLLGLPVGKVAGLIRGDGAGRGVSLLAWHCGRDPSTDPELLWSCGGGVQGEVSRRALDRVLLALACCVCASTAQAPRRCARDHLYCSACWSRLERCALCRDPLPPKESPLARNLVAEQVFEAIATEFEIKNIKKRPKASTSAYTTPNRSPNLSPNMSVNRRGQYQLSLMSRRKHVQFNERNKNYASDPNLHKSFDKVSIITPQNVPNSSHNFSGLTQNCNKESNFNKNVSVLAQNSIISNPEVLDAAQTLINVPNLQQKIPDLAQFSQSGNTKCHCQRVAEKVTCSCESDRCQCQIKAQIKNMPRINVEDSDEAGSRIPHRLITSLRPACSLADLPSCLVPSCAASRSLNDLHRCKAHSSLENIKDHSSMVNDSPVFLLSPQPVYLVTCEHSASR